jgi:hypothetical protein
VRALTLLTALPALREFHDSLMDSALETAFSATGA